MKQAFYHIIDFVEPIFYFVVYILLYLIPPTIIILIISFLSPRFRSWFSSLITYASLSKKTLNKEEFDEMYSKGQARASKLRRWMFWVGLILFIYIFISFLIGVANPWV
jgi:ABC-type sugar transport system permease subunit